jgi:hypothetical protein
MGEYLDTPADVLVVLTILSLLLGGLAWVIKAVSALQRQTRPNGGSSLRDAFDRLEASVGEMHTDVREIRAAQTRHTDWHLEHGRDGH